MARAPALPSVEGSVEGSLEGSVEEGAPPTRHRHPADVAHLIVATATATLLGALQVLEPGGLRRLGRDALDLVDRIPPVVADILDGCFQAIAIGVPLLVALGLVRARRGRLLGTLVIAGT